MTSDSEEINWIKNQIKKLEKRADELELQKKYFEVSTIKFKIMQKRMEITKICMHICEKVLNRKTRKKNR